MVKGKSRGKSLTRLSFLLILVVGLIFLYAQSFNPSAVFPQNTEYWNKILTGYLVIFALVLIVTSIIAKDVIKALATANYWEAFFMRFIPSAIVTSIILILIKAVLKGVGSVNIFQAISYMPWTVLLVHLFVVSQIEEILFGGLIFTVIEKKSNSKIANIITMIAFGIWHFAKTGGSWVLMLMYMPLRLWWNYNRSHGTPLLNKVFPKIFGPSPLTQQSNAGAHFGWNAFVIGFVEPFRI